MEAGLEIRLEDEWEADDIIEYCKTAGIVCHVLSKSELKRLTTREFLSMPFFCRTGVVQKYLKEAGLMEAVVPDTYTSLFGGLYGRQIKRYTYKELKELKDFPFFFKPASNDKLFDGCVVTDQEHIEEVLELNSVEKSAAETMEVYVCDVVKFTSERRLFVGGGKVYAIGHQFGDNGLPLDASFVESIEKMSGGKYYAVDVGFLASSNTWVIVEVNPPFALDDWGIDTQTYVQYGIDFWKKEISGAI